MTDQGKAHSSPPGAARWRLDQAPVHVRALATVFLCVVGMGLLTAHVNLYLSHRHADGDPSFSLDDVFADLHGREGTRPLVRAVNGRMRQYVQSDEEAEAIIAWAEEDGPERSYHLEIADVFSDRCVKCHSITGEAGNRLLTSYDEAKKYAARGWDAPTWEHIARVTHVHLLSLGALWTLVGIVTVLSGPASLGRSALAAVPLLGIALDVAGMWLSPLARPLVWLSLTGGAAMGTGFLCQFVLVMYSLWLKPGAPPPD